MIEYENFIEQNSQFITLCGERLNCNAFLFETSDEVFLQNFSYCFAKFLLCTGENKPCDECLNCKKMSLLAHSDVKIYPQNRKNILVEDVKNLIENVYLAPIESDKKIFIFNNFSSATVGAQNKLLKILEEPPQNAFIILNVTNVSKVLPTILSRCKKIRLNSIDEADLEKIVSRDKTREETSAIISASNGQLSKAIKYANDSDFQNVYRDVLNTIKNLKNSKELIKFSSKLTAKKENIKVIFELFESFYRDILLIRLKSENLCKNKLEINSLKEISSEYTCDAVDLIIKKIYEIRKQMEFNCNAVLLMDNFLLYVLEVKFLCNKK